MNNKCRAYYFPKFSFKPVSIISTLRFNDPLTAIGSILLFAMWLLVTVAGGALYTVFFLLHAITWALGKLVDAAF